MKLRGRAREVTFHVFDPRIVEGILDRDWVTDWREEDAAAAAENKRRAAWRGRITRVAGVRSRPSLKGTDAKASLRLVAWDDFERPASPAQSALTERLCHVVAVPLKLGD